jgi:hypothetical protein
MDSRPSQVYKTHANDGMGNNPVCNDLFAMLSTGAEG